jgi:predicted nicotinamide N-methyase
MGNKTAEQHKQLMKGKI